MMLNEGMVKKAVKNARYFLKEIENDYDEEELQDMSTKIKEREQEWKTRIKTQRYKKEMLNLILSVFCSYSCIEDIVSDYLYNGDIDYIDYGGRLIDLMLLQEYVNNITLKEMSNELLT